MKKAAEEKRRDQKFLNTKGKNAHEAYRIQRIQTKRINKEDKQWRGRILEKMAKAYGENQQLVLAQYKR